MNFFGIHLALVTFIIIGLGFVWVIRGERHLGYLWWPYILFAGLLIVVGSLFVSNDWLSGVLGAVGASLVWGATELKEQAIRAELGWFKFNARKVKPPFVEIIKKWKAPHL